MGLRYISAFLVPADTTPLAAMSVILSVLCYLLESTHSDSSALISTLISNYRSAQAANIQSHHDMNQLKWVFTK